jgi:hypothetical protein
MLDRRSPGADNGIVGQRGRLRSLEGYSGGCRERQGRQWSVGAGGLEMTIGRRAQTVDFAIGL